MPIPKIEARSSTMSQRLGFHDPDLTSPEHDAMVFWVKNYLKKDIFWTIRALQQIHKAKISNEKFQGKKINELCVRLAFTIEFATNYDPTRSLGFYYWIV